MKELPATLVLRPFGSDTLAVVAYNLARDERLAEAALPSLAIVAVGLIPVVLLFVPAPSGPKPRPRASAPHHGTQAALPDARNPPGPNRTGRRQ